MHQQTAWKRHSNVVSRKWNNNSPGTPRQVTEDRDLTDKEVKTADTKKCDKLQENPKRQFSELRNKINEWEGCFTEEIEILNENDTELLE